MGRDFKIGLIAGLVLAVLALIWVATRPSLSTHARMQGPSAASSRQQTQHDSRAPAAVAPPPAIPTDGNAEAGDTRPPGVIPAEPETVRGPFVQADPAEEPAPTPVEQEEKITTTRFHIVRRGENLSTISQQYYGSANQWQKILEANKDTLKDPNKIAPGMKLIIPD